MRKRCCFVSLMLLLAGVAWVAAPAKIDDLLVYLPMDEGAGSDVADASGNGFDGTVNGGKWVDGQFGSNALELVAAEEVRIEDDPALDGGEEFTIGLWVFQEIEQATGLIQKGTNWPDVSYLLPPWSDGQIYFGVNVTDSRAISKPGTHSLGEWYHVAGTFDGSDLKLYIDGALAAEAPAPVDVAPDTTSPVLLGNRFAGQIDEFVMYSRALSEEELEAIFTGDFLAVEARDKLATTWGAVKAR